MITSGLRRYRDLLQVLGVRRSVLPALIGKLQPGMYGLSLLMVLSRHLEFGAAALIASGASWGTMTTPVRGRLLDRFPYGRVLWPLLGLNLGFLALLMIGLEKGFPLPVLFATVLCASIVVPPLGVVNRVIWRARASGALLPTALALDAVLADIGFMIGPVVVVGLGQLIAPAAGIVTCAVLLVVAVPLVLRNSRGITVERPSRGHWAGPLHRSRSRRVLLVASLFFFGVSLLQTVLAAHGSGHEVTLTGGAVLSLLAVASVTGGLVVGGLPSAVSGRLARPAVMISMIGCAVLLMAALLLVADWTVYLSCIPVGLCLGPSFVAVYGAAGEAAGPGEQAETQAWVASALMAGGALGTAIGGWTMQHHGQVPALALGGLGMLLGGLAGTRVATRKKLPERETHAMVIGTTSNPTIASTRWSDMDCQVGRPPSLSWAISLRARRTAGGRTGRVSR
ncbi:MFS transporter [Kineosporia sp. NBRC 101731]|uniref:MFS transporter n=1 Tax=Kineosporia sp. NBRC 101731 TaxID=3032199 RepID=UPI0024A3E2A3|nr:MFS transporter [Kineosporia sp. NBRC 101731]GLY28805.1 MFS transporter [Kineosporia sp. NBRC 101731]